MNSDDCARVPPFSPPSLFLYTHTNIHSSIYKTFQHLWQLARQSGIYTRNKDNNNNNKQTEKKQLHSPKFCTL